MEYLHGIFKTKRPWRLNGNLSRYLAVSPIPRSYVGKFVSQIKATITCPPSSTAATGWTRSKSIACASSRIVKITGEFWAQTTEGDGNFNMFRFLQREGAQVLVDRSAPGSCT